MRDQDEWKQIMDTEDGALSPLRCAVNVGKLLMDIQNHPKTRAENTAKVLEEIRVYRIKCRIFDGISRGKGVNWEIACLADADRAASLRQQWLDITATLGVNPANGKALFARQEHFNFVIELIEDLTAETETLRHGEAKLLRILLDREINEMEVIALVAKLTPRKRKCR